MDAPGMSGTHGFLFADLRGYTATAERWGDAAAAELLERYRALTRAAVARHQGAEIRTEGDSFYVVFPSASSAVRCGLSIVESASAAAGDPTRPGIAVAVGIHAGETVETPEGHVGTAVNIAARVCGAARAGEVLVTATVRSLTRTVLPVAFVPRGRTRLKGIQEQVEVYRAVAADGQTARPPRPWQSAGRPVALAGAAVAIVAVAWLAVLAARPGDVGIRVSSVPGSAGAAATPEPTMTGQPSLRLTIPSWVAAARCVPQQVAPEAPGAALTVLCRQPPGSGAGSVWFHQFANQPALRDAVRAITAAARVPPGECAVSAEADGTWRHAEEFSGRLVCFQTGGAAPRSWIVWTYDEHMILARAERRDADAAALYRWWQATAPFLY